MKKKQTQSAEQFVRDLLVRCNVISPPIPVERLVSALGAVLRSEPFSEKELRGFFVRGNGSIKNDLIWVNPWQAPNMRRFVIAHEIAHMVLQGREVHVVRPRKVNTFDVSSRATDSEDTRANQFAFELLMPKRMLVADLKSKPMEPHDDEALKRLAKRYAVSLQALTLRLQRLELLPPVL